MQPGDTLVVTYEPLRELGQTPTSVLFEGRNIETGRPVTLIQLRLSRGATKLAALRCLDDALAAASVDHRHVLALHDLCWSSSGEPVLIGEPVQGRLLTSELARRRYLSPAESATVGLQICRALSGAHGVGVLHRSLSTDSVLLTSTVEEPLVVKVFGFGQLHLLASSRGAVEGGAPSLRAHIAAYLAPEAESAEVDQRADVFSVGAILYKLLTGVAPYFSGGDGFESPTELEPPSLLCPDGELPEGLSVIIERALCPDRERRLESVDALAAALGPFASPELSEEAGLETIPAPPASAVVEEPARTTIPAEDLIEETELLSQATLSEASAPTEGTELFSPEALTEAIGEYGAAVADLERLPGEEPPATIPYTGPPPEHSTPLVERDDRGSEEPQATEVRPRGPLEKRAVAPGPKPPKPKRRRLGALLVGVVALLVIAGGSAVGLSFTRRRGPTPQAPTDRPTATTDDGARERPGEAPEPSPQEAVTAIDPLLITGEPSEEEAAPADLERRLASGRRHLSKNRPWRCLHSLGSFQAPPELVKLRVECLEAAGRSAEACQLARRQPQDEWLRAWQVLQCRSADAE